MTAVKLSNEYLALIRRFPLVPIKNKHHLGDAIALLKELTTPSRLNALTNDENDYLDVLTEIIAKYEKSHWTQLAEAMTPAEALQYLLEQSGLSQSELARQTNTRQSHISEFLAGVRELSKSNIVRIARYFHVTPELFLSAE